MSELISKHLEILKAINKEKGTIVKNVEELMKPFQIWDKLDESQIRNVINVANSTLCVPVVTNFIKYQIGRKTGWQEGGFGELVIKKLNALELKAEYIDKENSLEIWIKLVRLFLGYMGRYYKYLKEGGKL